jgi:hypothetical protein
MRACGLFVVSVVLALVLAGCDPTTDSHYFRFGIGTDLYSSDIARETQYQDVYLAELCRQALPVLVSAENQCLATIPDPNAWNLIVAAGMNDIDRRCDAYLAWLDDRRRTNGALLKELGDVTVASQAIMRTAHVGADPITLAGLAFGLASNTFTNINSRLLLEVDKTTVETLVIRRRNEFRVDVNGKTIGDRPTAVHALRLYLTICTPFAIETDINSTVTIFQQAGVQGLQAKGPLVNADTIRSVTTFGPDSSSAILKAWLSPGGILDAERRQKIREFIQRENLNTQITLFLNATQFSRKRAQFIQEQGIR